MGLGKRKAATIQALVEATALRESVVALVNQHRQRRKPAAKNKKGGNQRWAELQQAAQTLPPDIMPGVMASIAQINALYWDVVVWNASLAADYARKWEPSGVPFGDLYAAAELGLFITAQKFEPHRNIAFSTYAQQWMRAKVSRMVMEDKTIRVPVYMMERASKLRRMEHAGRSKAEIRDWLAIDETDYIAAKDMRFSMTQLDAPVRADHDQTYAEVIPAEPTNDNTFWGGDIDILSRSLKVMDPRLALILCKRYGLGDDDPMPLEDVGAILGVTRERVRQLEKRALENIRAIMVKGVKPRRVHSGGQRPMPELPPSRRVKLKPRGRPPTNIIDPTFGDKVRDARGLIDMTQADLSRAMAEVLRRRGHVWTNASVSSALSRLECQNKGSLVLAEAAAEVLGLPIGSHRRRAGP